MTPFQLRELIEKAFSQGYGRHEMAARKGAKDQLVIVAPKLLELWEAAAEGHDMGEVMWAPVVDALDRLEEA